MLMRNEYFFLSNFYPCNIKIEIDGKLLTFKNGEAAFQAQKNFSRSEEFTSLTPLEAKRMGRKVELTTPHWNNYRLTAMAKVLHSKFSDPGMLYLLENVEGEIAEDNTWNDTYWGRCRGKGKNILGLMLMNIRDNDNDWGSLLELKNELEGKINE